MRGRDAAEFLLRRPQLAARDGEQLVDADREPFLELQLPLELLAAQPERGAGARRQLGLEVAAVAAERVGGFHRRVGQVAQQVEVVHARERARQVVLDELQDALQRVEADLGEDARRLLHVVARGLDEARRLAQLRQHAARPLVLGRVREDRLRGQARRQDVGVELRVPFPGSNLFDFEDPGPDVRGDDRMLDPLDLGEPLERNLIEPAGESRQGASLQFERAPAQVLEQVVVRVHAVERGAGRLRFVEIPQVIVDEMVKWFG